jgi:hypothetical protein
MNNVGDTVIIHNSCGTGPDVHVDNQLGVGDVVGDIDNGSSSLMTYQEIITDNNTYQRNNTSIHLHDSTPLQQHN